MAQYFVFLALAPVAILVSSSTFIISSIYRKRIGFSTLRIFLLSQLLYVVGNCLELIDPTEAGTVFWAQVEYLFIASGPVLWFLFSMEYAGFRDWLKPVRILLISAIPAATFVFAALNSSLHLIWREYRFERVLGMLVMRVSRYGPWLWVHFAYCYALMFLGGLAIFLKFFQSHSFYRRQTSLIIVGVILPLAFNSIYLLKLIPGLTKDFSPVAFGLGGGCIAVGIIRFRLSNLSPVPRSVLVEELDEGILVVDGEYRLIDINPAAERLLGIDGDKVVGVGARSIFPAWGPEILPGAGESRRSSLDFAVPGGGGRIDVSIALAERAGRGKGAYTMVIRGRIDAREPQAEAAAEDAGGDRFPGIAIDREGRIVSSTLMADILDYPEERLAAKRIEDITVGDVPASPALSEGFIDLGLLKRTGETIRAIVRVKALGENRRDGSLWKLTCVDMRFPREVFSIRENQVLDLIAHGLTNKEIGERLFVSENTVKSHLKNIFKKTGTNKRSHLLRLVMAE
jgi:DNA-binding CsgD family transcriptional regulator/PAS domain-containing protein